MRKTETIDRRAFDLMLDHLDGDIQASLRTDLIEWAGGDTCEQIEVSMDSMGRLDSESSPRPGDHSEPFTFIEPGGYKETTFAEAHRTGRPAIEIAQERVDRSAARTAGETGASELATRIANRVLDIDGIHYDLLQVDGNGREDVAAYIGAIARMIDGELKFKPNKPISQTFLETLDASAAATARETDDVPEPYCGQCGRPMENRRFTRSYADGRYSAVLCCSAKCLAENTGENPPESVNPRFDEEDEEEKFELEDEDDVREAFWSAHPGYRDSRDDNKNQNDYRPDIRMAFINWTDAQHLDGKMSDELIKEVALA